MEVFFAGEVIFSSDISDLKIQIFYILFSFFLQAFACLVSKATYYFIVNYLTSNYY